MRRIAVAVAAVGIAALTACSQGDTSAPADVAEPSAEPAALSSHTWGDTVTSSDGMHDFTVSAPVEEPVENVDSGDTVDGVRIDVTYTNNTGETVDAFDIILGTILFSGTSEGEFAFCDGQDPDWERPVPAGRTYEWSQCYEVENPADAVYIITPPGDEAVPISYEG